MFAEIEIKNTEAKGRTVIIKDVRVLKSCFSKAWGLMFSTKPKNLLFEFRKETKVSIHMFFVFFPIDVVFVDKNMNIFMVKESLKPWKVAFSGKKARYVIELKSGTVKSKNIKKGCKVVIAYPNSKCSNKNYGGHK